MGMGVPYLGHGVGLRTVHFPEVFAGTAKVDWFEAISENFMIQGGRPLRALERAREIAPVVLHGVSLSIGSVDPLSVRYLDDLARLSARIEPAWISDHLCWGSVGGHYAHDLLPLPYTEEALAHVVERIDRVQAMLRRRILIENVSSYLTYVDSVMPEWEFLGEVARRSDCGILLDVNNVYVSAINHGFDPLQYLEAVPADRVGQIHLAGHRDQGTHLLDTHDAPVCADVWSLYRATIGRLGRVSTLIEWDEDVPPWNELVAEAERARTVECEALGSDAATA
ncbi:MAG: DUF692 domain-containing protein [Deltaproteobacteria bacterium]|nr:DUF692 domain-containing protein [Deltaproteobacteria bacterium]